MRFVNPILQMRKAGSSLHETPWKYGIIISIQCFEFKWKHLIFVPEIEMTSKNGISALLGD